jgi:hypothetical protein
MAIQPKYRGTLPGRTRQWFFDLEKDGAVLSPKPYYIGKGASLEWSQDKFDVALDQYVMPAELSFEITDPGSVIWEDIRTSDQFSFTVRVYDSLQEYDIRLFLRLASSFTPLQTGIRQPVTQLVGFCGLTRTPEQEAYTATPAITLNGLFVDLLVDTLHSQNVQYLFAWRGNRVGSTGAWVDKIRFDDIVSTYTELDGSIEPAGDELADLAEGFQTIVFNDFNWPRRWFVAHPWLLGASIDAGDRLSNTYDVDADSISETAYPGGLVRLISDDNTLQGIYNADEAVEIERGYPDDTVVDTQIQRGAFTESWNTSTDNDNWEQNTPGILNESTNNWAYIEAGGNEIWHNGPFFKEGEDIIFFITFSYGAVYTSGGGGTASFEIEVRAVPLDPSGTTYYMDNTVASGAAGAEWTAVPTALTLPSSGPFTPDPFGTLPGSVTVEETRVVSVRGGFPNDGYIEFRIKGDTGSDWDLWIKTDDFEIDMNVADNNAPYSEWTARFKSSHMGGNVLEGNVVEFKRKWLQAQILRAGLDVQMSIDAGVLSWEVAGQWRGQIVGADTKFHDLAHLFAFCRLARSPLDLRIIKGTHFGILTPRNTLSKDTDEFIPYYLDLEFHTELTSFSAYENVVDLSAS